MLKYGKAKGNDGKITKAVKPESVPKQANVAPEKRLETVVEKTKGD